MWTLGKWAILTHDELEKVKDEAKVSGYQAGIRSKWKAAKKGRSFVDDILAANRGDTSTPVGKILNGVVDPTSDVTALLAAVEDGVVLPQRAA
jgi:hypothetical protein